MKLRTLAIIVATLATSLFMAPASKASNWTLIYQTTSSQRNSSEYINYTSGYERNGAAQIAATGQNFSQVRWRMELTVGATAYYVDAYFDKWAGATLADLQFPDYANLLILQKNVSNLVVTSNYPTVKNGSYALGRIEVWPYNYTQTASGITPAGSSSTFDFDETYSPGASGHGTFQLHNLTDTQTVLAWNRSRYNDNAETGFGPCLIGANLATPCTNPDWTLETGLGVSGFKFQVYIGTAAPSASTVGISVASSAVYRTPTTVTANLGVAGSDGRVTFYQNGKKIPGCIGIQSSGLVATCSWRPSIRGSVRISASLTPASSGFSVSNSNSLQSSVVARAGNR